METDICHAVLVGDEVLFLWDILWEFFLPEQPYTITRLLHLPSFQPRDPPPSFPLEPPQLNLLLNLPLVSQVRNGLQSHWFIPSTQVSVIPLGKKKKKDEAKIIPSPGRRETKQALCVLKDHRRTDPILRRTKIGGWSTRRSPRSSNIYGSLPRTSLWEQWWTRHHPSHGQRKETGN